MPNALKRFIQQFMHINCTDSQGFIYAQGCVQIALIQGGGGSGGQQSGWFQGVLNDDTNLSCPLKKSERERV